MVAVERGDRSRRLSADTSRLLRLPLSVGHDDRSVRLGNCRTGEATSSPSRRLVGPHQVLPAGRDADLRCVRSPRLRVLRGDSGCHARRAVSARSVAERDDAWLAPHPPNERRTRCFARTVRSRFLSGIPETAVLVQICLSKRSNLLVRQPASCDSTEGRSVVHQLQQMRGDLSVRCHQARLHDARDRLCVMPVMRRSLSDSFDQVCRTLEQSGTEGRKRSSHERDSHRTPRISVACGWKCDSGRGWNRTDGGDQGVRRKPRRSERMPSRASAR